MKTILLIFAVLLSVGVAGQEAGENKINRKLLTPEQRIERSGNLFISAGATLIFSGLLISSGVLADAPILTYAGGIACGSGICIMIGAGANLKKAGQGKPTAF